MRAKLEKLRASIENWRPEPKPGFLSIPGRYPNVLRAFQRARMDGQKHLHINRRGLVFFLGVILTAWRLSQSSAPDAAVLHACLELPTGALVEPYVMDARAASPT